MWQDIGTALALVLVIEGIIPFLAPSRWRNLTAVIAQVDNQSIRIVGFVSMMAGLLLLYLVR
ncbi:MAG: DUF2065 domain-containing protein [Pseudomonadales bacterium]